MTRLTHRMTIVEAVLIAVLAVFFTACNESHPGVKEPVKKTAKKVHHKKTPRVQKETGPFTYRTYRRYRISLDSANGTLLAYTDYCDFNDADGKIEFKSESESYEYVVVRDSLFLTRNGTTEVYYNKNAKFYGRWEYVSSCENDACVGLPDGTAMARTFTKDSMVLAVTWRDYCFMDSYDNFDIHPTDDAISKTNCREGNIDAGSGQKILFRLETLSEKDLVYSYSAGDARCEYRLRFGTWTPAECKAAKDNSEYLGVSYRHETNTEEFNACMAELYKGLGLEFKPKTAAEDD